MFKNLISPIQQWLLSQNRCVGCGEDLDKGKKSENKDLTLITCRCGRIFVQNLQTGLCRRAMFDEI